jgi:MFS family permease
MAGEPESLDDSRGPQISKSKTRNGWKPYHTAWVWLFLAWMFLYIDRSITGPVVAWMIDNNVAFMVDAPMPHALGGIIGGMFFAGYMLTQFPAGYLGDRFGRKTMVVISTVWAGVATFISALTRSLNGFVAARVFTGLGEGAYYSNDRALVSEVTPKEKKGFGMGVVFVGLSAGLTIATIATPFILDLAADAWGNETAWFVPFLLFSIPTVLVAMGVMRFVRPPGERKQRFLPALTRLLIFSGIFMAIIMATFTLTLDQGWGPMEQALAVVFVALVLVAVIYRLLGQKSAAVLKDGNLILMYVSAVPILYTLWFFGFWSLLVVSEASDIGLSGAAVYAGLFGVANAIGYPLGGKICDRMVSRGSGRKWPYIALCAMVGTLVLFLAVYLWAGGNDLFVLGITMFSIGIPFAAMQTVHMTLTSDLAPKEMMGQAFGMWNLVAEIGAVLSPVVAGTLRDITGDWTMSVVVTGILLLISASIVLLVRERPESEAIP